MLAPANNPVTSFFIFAAIVAEVLAALALPAAFVALCTELCSLIEALAALVDASIE